MGIKKLTTTVLVSFVFMASAAFATNIIPVLSILLLSPDSTLTFVPGTTTSVDSVQVLPSGGDVQFDANSPLKDVKISFAAGAVDTTTNVTFGTNSGVIVGLEGGAQAPFILNIDVPEGKEEFNSLVKISAPFEGDRLPVPVYIDKEGEIYTLSIVNVDWTEHRFTFTTGHASWFSWIIPTANAPDVFTTGFYTGVDGFFVENAGTPQNPGGQCAGMAAFSQWYFDTEKTSETTLYEEFRDDISTDVNQTILVQDVIASRAHISATYGFFKYDSEIIDSIKNLSHEDRYMGVADGLRITGKPQLLYLVGGPNDDRYAHAVLAYEYLENADSSDIYVYDPNSPNNEKIITYSKSSKKWESYEPFGENSLSFDAVVLYGNGTAHTNELFSDILMDAKANFNGTNKALININSHTSGEVVSSESMSIAGFVSNGDILVDDIGLIVNSRNIIQAQAPSGGGFQFDIQLEDGKNYLTFATRGLDSKGNVINVPNSMDTTGFNVVLDSIQPPSTYPLNDTGITWGGDYPSGNNATCTSNITSSQDCHQGRDSTHNDDSDGHAGFSFTKLDASGTPLLASATNWSCVKDNITGLIWEVKTDDNSIHDKDNTYRWGGKTHQGNFGTEFYPDWDTLVDGSNNQSLCGYIDWRVPTVNELEGLVNLNQMNLAIDIAYFPSTPDSISFFWSASPNTYGSSNAWLVNFREGGSNPTSSRNYPRPVRLVRSGQ